MMISPEHPEHPETVAHLSVCAACQDAARSHLDEIDLSRVWTGVAAEIWASPVGVIERLAERALRSTALARALVTTPALILSWLIATVAVFVAGVVVTRATGDPWVALLAPAVAGAGIAYAYGPGVDPAFELSRTMAISDRMVLLVRGFAVFGLNALLGLIASLFVSGLSGLTVTWLAPMTTVAALALAVATMTQSPNVGVGAGIAVWCIVVLIGKVETGDIAAMLARGIVPLYAAATVILLLIVMRATRDVGVLPTRWRVNP